MNRLCFETFNKTSRDIMRAKNDDNVRNEDKILVILEKLCL